MLFFRVWQNNRLFQVKVRICGPGSKCGFAVFYSEFTLLATGVEYHFFTGSQCRRYGGVRGAVPPSRLLVPPPHFGLL